MTNKLTLKEIWLKHNLKRFDQIEEEKLIHRWSLLAIGVGAIVIIIALILRMVMRI